jgi:hypothetical protein
MKRTSMAQALSQAAGHAFSRPAATKPPIPDRGIDRPASHHSDRHTDLQAAAARRPAAPSTVPPSRVGKKPVTAFFDPEVSRQIKKLGLDQDKTMQDLLQEALNDLFRKYDLPPIA